MAINAGDVVWNIGADVTKLDKALAKASKGARGMADKFAKHSRAIGVGMTAAGGAIVATLGASIKKFAQTGDAVQKMAIRTGASTEAISELGFAAEQSGASMETIGKAFKAQADFLEDAKDGLSTSTDALDKLGISVTELEGLSPEQLFMKLSAAIGGVADPIQRAALANDVFRRSGQELLPLFAQGAEGIAVLRREAESLGISMSQEQADAAAQFGDSMNSLKSSLGGVAIQIGNALVPVLNDMVPKITEIVTKVIAWMKANQPLVKIIASVSAIVGGLLVTLGPLLVVLPGIVSLFGIISSVMAGAATAFGVVASIAAVVGAAIAAIGAPILLVIAGVTALTILIVKKWDFIKKVTINTWNAVKNAFSRAIDFMSSKLFRFLTPIGLVIEALKILANLMNQTGSGGNFASGGVVPGMATGGVVKGYASGGVTDHRIIKVGERGPELLAAPVGSQVLSHPKMMRAVSDGQRGGTTTMVASFNIDARDTRDPVAFFEVLKPTVHEWLVDGMREASI